MSFTEEQRWALEQFDALAQKLGSQNKACAVVGVSAAIISPLKKGTYPGDSSAQFGKLISYFKTKEEAAASPAQGLIVGDYVQTSISSKVYDGIRNCQLKGGLALICGDAGVGKSKAAEKFVEDHPNDAVMITLNPCFASLKSTLKMLCRALNVNERNIADMWIGIVGKLRDGMVLIIDEAQHTPPKTIEAIRAMPDYFYRHGKTLGVVFIGNLKAVGKFGGERDAEFAQISNRTKQKRVYLTSQIRKSDIQLLFPELRDAMSVDFLLKVARSAQAIRGAVNLYSNALDNDNTSYEGLVAMAKHMEMVV
jgi:DNA transposition AAA+ family ATPase